MTNINKKDYYYQQDLFVDAMLDSMRNKHVASAEKITIFLHKTQDTLIHLN